LAVNSQRHAIQDVNGVALCIANRRKVLAGCDVNCCHSKLSPPQL